MQSRVTFAFILTSLLTAAALSSGCIIVAENGNTGGGGAGGTGGTGPGVGGTGGMGGTGGTGGMGGMGGTGGAGGAGGANCVDDSDGTTDVAACDAMNITPQPNGPAAQCQSAGSEPFDPPGYGTCKRAFEIYTKGAASVLQVCLADIGVEPANACNEELVVTCVGKMYAAACPSDDGALACDTIAKSLCINGETFDTQGCLVETNPFNNAALQDLADCITNSSEPNCNDAYDACFATITSY